MVQNNLEEELRKLNGGGAGRSAKRLAAGSEAGGGSAGSTSASSFRPTRAADTSFQRQSSTGSTVGSAIAQSSVRSKLSAPPRPAQGPAPQIPAKRASSPVEQTQSTSAQQPPPAKRIVSRPSAPEQHAALRSGTSSIAPAKPANAPSSQGSSASQAPSALVDADDAALQTLTTEELNAKLAEANEAMKKLLSNMVDILMQSRPDTLAVKLLEVQRNYLDRQIASLERHIEARSFDTGGPATGSATTASIPTLSSVLSPARRPFADLSATANVNTGPASAKGPHSTSTPAASSFASSSSTKIKSGQHEAILIEDSPSNSPQRPARPPSPFPDVDESFQNAGDADDPPALLSERAAGKQRATDDEWEYEDNLEEDARAGPASSEAILRRYVGSSTSHVHDAAAMNHPWSKDLYNGLRGTFKLREFRQNQLEAMNATLSGKDVFCLMPTGGGKSLCYQLPALLNSGKTRGVTVVISPLLSLIHDQVESLMDKDIPALALTGEQTKDVRDFVMAELCQPVPPVKLLYVTPEFVTKSGRAREIFGLLHRRKQLGRFVIDEAHCVSQWGHDFRPDYKELGILRRECPGIPIMAMTATANHRVETDVVNQLGIKDCVHLKQSFNRHNLSYEVRVKKKDCLSDMASVIRTTYAQDCGIIYCLSRASCEDVAHKLSTNYGIEARHYHAGLNKKERMMVQRKWQKGEFKVIVATIAFGMGIDKADVRFVMHHTLPSSLEGYYQETGRAGRDGKSSICILYYAFKDSATIQHLIEKGEGTQEQKEQRRTNLRQVISYCMNKTDCRRVQVLQYFGEIFKREDCHNSCDNCKDHKGETKTIDVTEYAKSAVRLVSGLTKRARGPGFTMLHCVDVFRGADKKSVRERGHDRCPEYGKGAKLPRGDAERLFQLLILERILSERSDVNVMGFAHAYMQTGKEADNLMRGNRRLEMQVAVGPAASASASSAATGANRRRTLGLSSRDRTHGAHANQSDPLDLVDFDLDAGEEEDAEERPRPPMAPSISVAQPRKQPPKAAKTSVGTTAKSTNKSRARTGPLRVVDSETTAKCLAELKEKRTQLAFANECTEADVVENSVLQALAEALPTNMEELEAVEGLDETKALCISEDVLPVCRKYAKEAPSHEQRASQERFLSQFKYNASSSSRSNGQSSGSGAAAPRVKKATIKKTVSSSGSIRPLGVSGGGRSASSGTGKRPRAA